MSEAGKLKRGRFYHKILELNKDLPVDKKLTLPKQVGYDHADVLFFLSKQEKPQDLQKAVPPVSKKKEGKK